MKKKTVEYGKYGYLFIVPFFLVYLVFSLYPLIYTLYLSFVEYYQYKSKWVGPKFCGFDNYLSQLKSTGGQMNRTLASIINTLIIWIINFIPQVLLSLLLAAWFTDTSIKLKGTGAFKIMMFMPNIITASSIAVLFYSLFSRNGPLRQALVSMHIIGKDYDFMESGAATIGLIGFMQFWMWYGNTMIILIAGILGINPSLYEAAMVDGASGGQNFRYITFPLLMPILQFTLVTSAIGGLQMFDIPSLFNVNQNYDGLPNWRSETITMWIKRLGFSSRNYGRAAAASMILFIVTLVISMIFFVATKERQPKQKHAILEA